MRALALGGGLFGSGVAACSSPKPAPATDAQVDLADTRPDVQYDVVEAGASDGGGGHCHAPDDDALVDCPSGTACSTDELGLPVCVVPPEDFDAGIQACGGVGCNRSGSCYCANAMNSFCECTTSAGPLAPPDLPTSLTVC